MSDYDLHLDGNCNPWTCLACANECAGCGNHLNHCTCPTLPLDEEEDPA